MPARPERTIDRRAIGRLSRLQLRARLAMEGFYSGIHKSPYHGFNVEFAEYREYTPGDDLRHLDWRVLARTDRLFIKQFEAETNLNCYLLLDCSRSMDFGSNSETRLDYGAALAAALALMMLRQGIRPGEDTNIAGVLHEMAERMRRRSMAIIISDFFDDDEEVLRGLQHFRHLRHEVIVLHLLDDAELSFPFDRVTLFEGMERGEELVVDPRVMAEGYHRRFQAYLERLRKGCTEKNIDYERMMLSEPFDRALSAYLGRRK